MSFATSASTLDQKDPLSAHAPYLAPYPAHSALKTVPPPFTPSVLIHLLVRPPLCQP